MQVRYVTTANVLGLSNNSQNKWVASVFRCFFLLLPSQENKVYCNLEVKDEMLPLKLIAKFLLTSNRLGFQPRIVLTTEVITSIDTKF